MDALDAEKTTLEEQFQILIVPKDPNDDKNTIMEIRAGTGGEESALFAADLLRMYQRYLERKGWKVEVLSSNETGMGGFKEVMLLIAGDGAYGRLKYESGVHRVQRVPATEASGRIHTSAASVAVLPEAEEVEIASIPTSCGSTCTVPAVRADRVSTPPTAPFASRTFRPGWWSPVRTRVRSSRTAPKR